MGVSVETGRGDGAATTWIFRGDGSSETEDFRRGRRYLVGISLLYSMDDPPSTAPPPFESEESSKESTGSPSRRVSHQRTWPSVETDAHWLPVLDEIQKTS